MMHAGGASPKGKHAAAFAPHAVRDKASFFIGRVFFCNGGMHKAKHARFSCQEAFPAKRFFALRPSFAGLVGVTGGLLSGYGISI